MRYIIQPGIEIGTPENKNLKINVLTPDEVNEYHNNGFKCKERIYPVILGRIEYEVICFEVWEKGGKEHSLIIPAFLLPRRIYPWYVYTSKSNNTSIG